MRLSPWLLLAALISAALPLAAQAPPDVDSFYVTLLHEGTQALEEGDAVRAARDLRLACFGLLEDPPRLAGCLAHLGLAQALAEDREGFTETFRRLAVVERRFSGYSRAGLPAAVREDFEQRLIHWIPAELLTEVSTFRPLADRQRAAELARLPPARRREELARRLTQEPDNPVWRLLLAELELEEENPVAAMAHVDRVLVADPGNAPARCLRGLARAGQGACGAAVSDLAGCSRSRGEEPFAEALLACRVSLGQGAAAAAFYASLPPELRESRKLSRLGREGERLAAAGGEQARAAVAPGTSDVGAGDSGASDVGASDPRSGPEPAPITSVGRLPPEDRARFEKARRMLGETRFAGELEEPLSLARQVADAHPGLVEAQHLAAQIAYRASKWQEAADFFRRGGDPGDDQPVLLFYMAVSFYEIGDPAAAARALRRALPHLEKTPFVSRYVERILGPEATP